MLELSRLEIIRRREYFKAHGINAMTQSQALADITVEQLRLEVEHEVIKSLLLKEQT